MIRLIVLVAYDECYDETAPFAFVVSREDDTVVAEDPLWRLR